MRDCVVVPGTRCALALRHGPAAVVVQLHSSARSSVPPQFFPFGRSLPEPRCIHLLALRNLLVLRAIATRVVRGRPHKKASVHSRASAAGRSAAALPPTT